MNAQFLAALGPPSQFCYFPFFYRFKRILTKYISKKENNNKRNARRVYSLLLIFIYNRRRGCKIKEWKHDALLLLSQTLWCFWRTVSLPNVIRAYDYLSCRTRRSYGPHNGVDVSDTMVFGLRLICCKHKQQPNWTNGGLRRNINLKLFCFELIDFNHHSTYLLPPFVHSGCVTSTFSHTRLLSEIKRNSYKYWAL